MSRIEKLKNKKNKNLIYSRTEEEKQPKGRGWLFIILILFIVAGLLYLLFFPGMLNINKIEVEGYDSPLAVQGIAQEIIDKNYFSKNILLFNKKALQETLMGDPQIQELKIKRLLPNKIVIEITQSKPALIWSSAGDKYLINDRGVVILPATDEELPEVFDGSNIKTKPGERVCSPAFINFINSIHRSFQGTTGVALSKITIFDILTDVHAMSADGWIVYFDASKTAEGQLKNLSRVLEEARASGQKLEYIDMRLDNKIFYK